MCVEYYIDTKLMFQAQLKDKDHIRCVRTQGTRLQTKSKQIHNTIL